MSTNLLVMARCSDFESPRKGARVTYAYIDATDAEVHAAGLESSEYVLDRGDREIDWVLRVPLDDIEDAPRCEHCNIAATSFSGSDLCRECEEDEYYGRRSYREPRECDFAVDEGPRDHIAYFARLGRPGY